ncbi:MAG: flagellar basal body rod protein FlgB [Alphaproteobacteria bacterium]|nr:flagellar basal body rod protein FlgB [Alphaproteobacteria bacterium]
MDWLTERQAVLAQNLSNTDTPNFKAKDLVQPDFKRVLEANGVADRPGALRATAAGAAGASGPVRLATTNPGHIARRSVELRTAAHAADRRNAEVSPSGNDVNLEDQISKVTETQMDYQMTANLYRKHLAMLKSVLRR